MRIWKWIFPDAIVLIKPARIIGKVNRKESRPFLWTKTHSKPFTYYLCSTSTIAPFEPTFLFGLHVRQNFTAPWRVVILNFVLSIPDSHHWPISNECSLFLTRQLRKTMIKRGFNEIEMKFLLAVASSFFVHEEHQIMPLTHTNMVDLSCK